MVERTRRILLRALRLSSGLVLLTIGVLGGFVPLLQGWVFVLAGLGLLAKDLPFLRRWLRPAIARIRLCRRRFRAARAERREGRREVERSR